MYDHFQNFKQHLMKRLKKDFDYILEYILIRFLT